MVVTAAVENYEALTAREGNRTRSSSTSPSELNTARGQPTTRREIIGLNFFGMLRQINVSESQVIYASWCQGNIDIRRLI